MYVIMFVTTRKKLQNEQEAITVTRNDIKLAIYGFCVFIAMFLYAVYAFLRAIVPKDDMEIWKLLILLYGVCNDVFSWCNPWLCLILLKKVRISMMTTLFCKQNIVTPVTNVIPIRNVL